MKAFITGATGFIGQNLIERLTDDGWEVNVLIRSKKDVEKFSQLKINSYQGDLQHLMLARKKIMTVDVVFNLAGALPYHRLPEKKYWEANVEGVRNLLALCKHSNIKRFVHISTVGIYGSAPKIGTDENSPLNLDSIYAKTKAIGEQLVSDFHKTYKLPTVIIRPTIAFGPHDTRPGFFNLFSLISKRLFIPIGNGHNFFHTIYVKNLIEALILVVNKREAVGEDFIIGDDPCPTIKQVIDTIARVENVKLPPLHLPILMARLCGIFFDLTSNFGLPAILNSQRVKFITENKKFKIDKAKKILGYKPRFNLKEGIRKTFEWYKEKGLL